MASHMQTTMSPIRSGRTQSRTRRSSSRHSSSNKPWEHRRTGSFRSEKTVEDPEERRQLARELSRQSTRRQPRWWKIRFFKGMIDDVKRRAPFYWSDWTDAWDYRVVPATTYMYFAKYVQEEIKLTNFLQTPVSFPFFKAPLIG